MTSESGHFSTIGNALKKFFARAPKSPKRWDKPDEKRSTLFTRDFILLFLMAMCSNSFIAVYYCFEQWMEGLGISPAWRGVCLSSLFAMILLFRPLTSIFMLRHGKFWAMTGSLVVCSLVMAAYPFVGPGHAIEVILALRIVQGVALAIYSACTVGVLVECIPPGQSARGFALFSLTMLLPYSIIPGISETLLPLVGGEANLFAVMGTLGLPSLVMLLLLAKRLKKPEVPPEEQKGMTAAGITRSLLHSGLGFLYMACLFFSITTVMAIFFMKGLCLVNGEHPAAFFTTYSLTIILVRVFGSHHMDTMPRHKVVVICAGVLALCMAGFALAPQWTFIPLALVYGLALGLLYPLLAAGVYDRSSPETRAINSNVMMATFDASGMLGPILGGLVLAANLGYRGVFITAAISVSLCGLCMLMDRLRLLREGKTRLATR